eukprot:TRINITY_DN26826_c0_g1_i1.p1 TRINITY_DN26826_c0_g1~~TRINITY_DN26826_c0_g1_i1.p1  ORF type:complete len:410 (+),score=90.11 TRINITY_DN26826_c0_g1_i1:148-1377(+)
MIPLSSVKMENTDDDARYPPTNPYAIQFQQFNHQYPPQNFHQHQYAPSASDPFLRSKLPPQRISSKHLQQDPSSFFVKEEAQEGEEEARTSASSSSTSEGTFGDAAHENEDEEEDEDDSSEGIAGAQGPSAIRTHQNQFEQKCFQNPVNPSPPNLETVPNYFEKSPRDEWAEEATWTLLESWAEKFLQAGKRSLKLFHWFEISKRVSSVSKTPKSDVHCRNRLDTLKKKYKKEKQRAIQTGISSNWVYFKFLDGLLGTNSTESSFPSNACLPYGVDAGQFVCSSQNRIGLNHSRLEDGPADSPSEEEEEEEHERENGDNLSGGRGTKRKKDNDEAVRSLSDSIRRFGEIYEKIENSKRQQMLELERMRKEFDRELKARKREIFEQTQMELDKILHVSDEIDPSVTNMSS